MDPMRCQEMEELLCDYVDGTLSAEGKAVFEEHAASCASCGELVAEVMGAVQFMERAAVVEPPQELLTRILYHTPKAAPLVEVLANREWLKSWLRPLLQPRFAMGMAMTILSFSMLGKFVAPVNQLKPSDLDPVKVWHNIDNSAHRTWDRFLKYYDNLRLVYEVQAAIEEMRRDDREEAASAAKAESKQDGESK
ncbi:MAG: zf-HC2 domain-containing protein [Bryobacter sp.]|jgi:hypothetical protein|nr:zf-HC2 domain-containing protein [Bryobacter sp. CoA8 C33]